MTTYTTRYAFKDGRFRKIRPWSDPLFIRERLALKRSRRLARRMRERDPSHDIELGRCV